MDTVFNYKGPFRNDIKWIGGKGGVCKKEIPDDARGGVRQKRQMMLTIING